jgi:hypothetical protein
MIGVSTETAIRLLGKLGEKRLIRTEGKEIVIIDAHRLGIVANVQSIET